MRTETQCAFFVSQVEYNYRPFNIVTFTEFLNSDASRSPHFLLLGNPVSHSLSPIMHNTAARHHGIDIRYYAVTLEQPELTRLPAHLNSESFQGANVTIPYKQVIMDFVDELDEAAREIGAVNTIVKNDYRLKGHNTDAYGFSVPLEPYSGQLEGGKALVFGTGGASRAIVYALQHLGINEIILISRNPGQVKMDVGTDVQIRGYEAWKDLAFDAVLLVNATPLGMSPRTETCPVRETEKQFLSGKICYDIVYNPVKTKFLTMAEQVGCTTLDGIEMLIHQGSRAFELWTGKSFPLDKVRNKVDEQLQERY